MKQLKDEEDVSEDVFQSMTKQEKWEYFLENYCYQDFFGEWRLTSTGELVEKKEGKR